jgi:hypothetical protein
MHEHDCQVVVLVFLNKKGRSTVISFKKKQLYITSRSDHHHHNNNNAHVQRTQQNSTPPQLGREAKGSHQELRRCCQRCATPKVAARCKPE